MRASDNARKCMSFGHGRVQVCPPWRKSKAFSPWRVSVNDWFIVSYLPANQTQPLADLRVITFGDPHACQFPHRNASSVSRHKP